MEIFNQNKPVSITENLNLEQYGGFHFSQVPFSTLRNQWKMKYNVFVSLLIFFQLTPILGISCLMKNIHFPLVPLIKVRNETGEKWFTIFFSFFLLVDLNPYHSVLDIKLGVPHWRLMWPVVAHIGYIIIKNFH